MTRLRVAQKVESCELGGAKACPVRKANKHIASQWRQDKWRAVRDIQDTPVRLAPAKFVLRKTAFVYARFRRSCPEKSCPDRGVLMPPPPETASACGAPIRSSVIAVAVAATAPKSGRCSLASRWPLAGVVAVSCATGVQVLCCQENDLVAAKAFPMPTLQLTAQIEVLEGLPTGAPA
jgi:hypothetical protein